MHVWVLIDAHAGEGPFALDTTSEVFETKDAAVAAAKALMEPVDAQDERRYEQVHGQLAWRLSDGDGYEEVIVVEQREVRG